MQAKDIYKLVSTRLQDLKTTRRWPWETPATDEDPSLQDFLNNALLNIALQRPDATASNKIFTCVAGVKQSLGANDLCLLDCLYGLDSSEDPVSVLTRVDKGYLDLITSGWYSEKDEVPIHWAYDRMLNPRVFWLYPGVENTSKIQVEMSIRPVEVAAPTDELVIQDLYKSALEAWVMYEIMASDTDDANWQKALQYQSSFYQILGVKSQIDSTYPIKLRKSEGS